MELNTVILGAGAAGLMCAAHAGPGTLVVDHARAPGEKIRISGGGRCNFTNMHCGPENFLSANPHFCKSALSRYTQWDFLDLVQRHGIAWHEKTLGQLFCDGSAKQIVAMMMQEAEAGGAEVWLQTSLAGLRHADGRYQLELEREGTRHSVSARNLVLATGGKSIPKMGATGLAYDIARQFGLEVTETRPALVPLTFPRERFEGLAGVSLPVRVTAGGASFDEAMLFTHRGISGPAVLQASSYWREGDSVTVDLAPDRKVTAELDALRHSAGKRQLSTALGVILPARLAQWLGTEWHLEGPLGAQSGTALTALESQLHAWQITPAGSEGYRTAEVTLGGVSTEGLSSRSLEALSVPGLHVIGEAVDVTGWLGGYNFQWAWSSGWAAGTAIAAGTSKP